MWCFIVKVSPYWWNLISMCAELYFQCFVSCNCFVLAFSQFMLQPKILKFVPADSFSHLWVTGTGLPSQLMPPICFMSRILALKLKRFGAPVKRILRIPFRAIILEQKKGGAGAICSSVAVLQTSSGELHSPRYWHVGACVQRSRPSLK